MATSATALLGLALPVTGELSGTWGDTVNDSLTALLDTAVSGTTTLSSDADVTLSTTTLAANQARQAVILWTAGGTATRTITAPAQSKTYVVINKTSSTQSIKLVGAGPTTGVTVVAGTAALVAWNGSDFEVVPTVVPTFPSGGIIMWSGSIASIPSGWYLCNGSNSTPDLRDRFVVGAGSTYAVAAIGGSADAVVVTHTHTATSTDSGHVHTQTDVYGAGYVAPGSPGNFTAFYPSSSSTGSSTANITTTNASAGVSGTNANLPPYYALAYIMKS